MGESEVWSRGSGSPDQELNRTAKPASVTPTGWTPRCSCCGLHASAPEMLEKGWDWSIPSLPTNRWVIRRRPEPDAALPPRSAPEGMGWLCRRCFCSRKGISCQKTNQGFRVSWREGRQALSFASPFLG